MNGKKDQAAQISTKELNEQEMLDVLHKFDERHQIKLISRVEMLAKEMLLSICQKQKQSNVVKREGNVVFVNFTG